MTTLPTSQDHHSFQAHKQADVETHVDFAIFQNLDHMGSIELAANLFRATQTEDKLKRDQIKSKSQSKRDANKIYCEVGDKIWGTIKSIGDTMPEELPTPEKSVLNIAKEQGRLARDNHDK